MKSLILLVAFCGLISALTLPEYQDAFISWMSEHNKFYTTEEFQGRFKAFKWNMDYVEAWNAKNSSTVLGMTYMADLTNKEYQRIYLGTRFDATERLANAEPSIFVMPTADTINWAERGAVTPVKNQGACGSCWSFSTTGAVEGAQKIKKGNLVSLSEQNLMDCSTAYGNGGCNGGLMTSAFKYIIANKGIDTEASYPYQAVNGACRFSANNVGATISSYAEIPSGNEGALQNAVNNQPVAVAIDASHNSFQLYKSGVYNEGACSPSKLDHGVLAIGYGTDNSNRQYWLVKNSWGTSWGLAGYIWMSKSAGNQCGIATMASYPTV